MPTDTTNHTAPSRCCVLRRPAALDRGEAECLYSGEGAACSRVWAAHCAQQLLPGRTACVPVRRIVPIFLNAFVSVWGSVQHDGAG